MKKTVNNNGITATLALKNEVAGKAQVQVPQKQFQYEVQQYQEDCVSNIISIFEKLQINQPFCDALNEHKQTQKFNFPVQDTKNIDIMMETGTGKTFTFIKTMFDLNRNFGYKKFIILVPTVPIREGTKTNLEDTKEYFKALYANEREKEIEVFVYESGQVATVKQFIYAEHLSALVLTPSSFNKDSNILNKPLESDTYVPNLFSDNQEPPKSLLECLKRLNPIIIMDEPHKFEGEAFQTFFKGFNNYYLRFGATFPKGDNKLSNFPKGGNKLSNVAYTLDSISSFRQNLVKKIVVYTQDIVQNKNSLACIDKVGSAYKATVNVLSNGIITKQVLSVGSRYNEHSITKINKDSIVLDNNEIVKVDYSLSDEALQQMIRVAVQVHFEKEKILFEQGIKALSLFFIESNIELFRGENPKIKKIFEEEYKLQRDEIFNSLPDCDYKKYLQNDFDADGNLCVHKGYFSGDKGNADDKIKAGTDEILKDKKKLLSFKSPTRFIFSIWALQEGWDNPNVFTICKLSNQGSEVSKLQQIGRGLRICVDQNLKRRTIKAFADNQEEFWKVNNLDVIVSNQEVGFVEAIQNEILSNSFFVNDTFTKQDIIIILKEKTKFTDTEILNLINNVLLCKQMAVFKCLSDDGQEIYEKSPNCSQLLTAEKPNLSDEQFSILENLFASDMKTFVRGKSNSKPKKKIIVKDEHKAEFAKIWAAINKNSLYFIDNLSPENYSALVQKIKTDIEKLQIDKIFLQTIRAKLNADKIGEDGAITTELTNTVPYKSKVNYLQFVQDLANNTRTPISFITTIFNAVNSDFKQKMLANDPKQALKEMSEIIKNHLVGDIKAKVRYDCIDGQINGQKTEFNAGELGKFQEDIAGDFSLKEQWLFKDVIEFDSDFEKDIILKDDKVQNIEIFGKLPNLEINTPLGKYNPDFCYSIKTDSNKKLILVVESKGYDTSQKIPPSEKAKIEFAKVYFAKLNEKLQNENTKIVFKERINTTQLTSLITEALNS
jgi:type III restriction enzyme